ncbi:D-alanine--D-alanine ligase [Candidatus Berkelbacteria bacterium]|nr:D-alanine--D-alanine ligase [Candidatus Berkelbacteria bacterium]
MIVILGGGDSLEREVSLKTAKTIESALKSLGVDYKIIDPANSGWLEQINLIRPEIAIIALHGTFGEDGRIQKILEEHGIKYTGSSSTTSELCFNKEKTKKELVKIGINSPETITNPQEFPVIVKPGAQGSSFGITKVMSAEDLSSAVTKAKNASENGEIIIEKFIEGREFTCAVTNLFGDVQALPIVEIVHNKTFFDFEAKYSTSNGAIEICPAEMVDDLERKIKDVSCKIFSHLGIGQYCRIDWIASEKELYFLEVNTLPGMTETSLINKEFKAAGISFESFIKKLISSTHKV